MSTLSRAPPTDARPPPRRVMTPCRRPGGATPRWTVLALHLTKPVLQHCGTLLAEQPAVVAARRSPTKRGALSPIESIARRQMGSRPNRKRLATNRLSVGSGPFLPFVARSSGQRCGRRPGSENRTLRRAQVEIRVAKVVFEGQLVDEAHRIEHVARDENALKAHGVHGGPGGRRPTPAPEYSDVGCPVPQFIIFPA